MSIDPKRHCPAERMTFDEEDDGGGDAPREWPDDRDDPYEDEGAEG